MVVTRTYRLEVTGREGWFIPAFEAEMPHDMPRDDVRHRMVAAMIERAPRYAADPELGEGYKLTELEPVVTCVGCKARRR